MAINERSLGNLRPRAAKAPERAAALALQRKAAAADMEASIEQMAANGLTPSQITMLTGLKADRLWRRYRDSMMKGEARRTNDVAQSAYLMSVGGPEKDWRRADPGMAKFWLERRGGASWAVSREDEKGPDLSRLSTEELQNLHRALQPLARGAIMIEGDFDLSEGKRNGPVIAAEFGGGDGGADASGAGAESAGGERVDQSGEGEVPG